MKKQRKSILIIVSILAAGALTAAAAGVWSANQPVPQQPGPQLTAQRSAAVGELDDPIYTYLANNFSGDALYEQVDVYATFKIKYQPTAAETQYLAGLLSAEKPLTAVLDAYLFWTTTNADLSLVGQMIGAYRPEYADSAYWTAEVYDSLTGKTGLTPEEVSAYLQEDGLTQEDIVLADELSRKDTASIQQLLNKRKQGKPWFDIAAEVYASLGMPFQVPQSKLPAYREIPRGRSILQAVFYASRSDKTLEQWLDLAVEGNLTDAAATYYDALCAGELQRLRGRGLFAPTGEDAQMDQQREALLQQRLADLQADPQQVAALQAEGYDTSEILNAAIDAGQSGRSLLQEMDQ